MPHMPLHQEPDNGKGHWWKHTLYGPDRIALPEILPDFELTVDQLFAWLRRP